MIKISNCPITGLRRRIYKKNFQWLEDPKQIRIECFIRHFKVIGLDGEGKEILEPVENARIKSYMKPLVASDSLVDPTDNGRVLTDQEIADYYQRLKDIENYPARVAQYQVELANYPIALEAYNNLPETDPNAPFQPQPPVLPVEPVEPEAPTFTPVQEYDFYVYVFGARVIILPNVILGIIAVRDSEGKFDNI